MKQIYAVFEIRQVRNEMTKKELAQAIRLDLSQENWAYLFIWTPMYRQPTMSRQAKKVLGRYSCDEEKAHIGELTTLMRYLDPEEAKFLEDGAEEVQAVDGRFRHRNWKQRRSSPEGATIGSPE